MSASITRDELLFNTLEKVEELNCSPVFAICQMIKEQVKKPGFTVNARGSSFISFEANSLDYAIKQFLKVRYYANDNTIIGNGVHSGADFGYKYFLETGKYPKRRLCIKEVIESAKKDYKFINPDLRTKTSVRELAAESVRLFKKYWWIMQNNTPIESEKSLFLEVPEEMLQNPQNKGKIRFTGTLDRIYKDANGKIIMSDLKTSKKRISAGVEHSKELAILVEREKALLEILKKIEKELEVLEKQKEKQSLNQEALNQVHTELSLMVFSNISLLQADLKEKQAAEKPNEKTILKIKDQIIEQEGFVVDYKLFDMVGLMGEVQEKVQSPKRLIAKLEKHQEAKDSSEVLNIDEVIQRKIKIKTELDEVSIDIEPLKREWLIEVRKAEIESAKAQYGTQLAFYAMIYMITENVKIDKLRVEVLVKNKKEPLVQVIEWDLDEAFMRGVYEKIQVTTSTIEAVLNGVDPMILFRTNSTSYIGSDTNELINEINGILSEREAS